MMHLILFTNNLKETTYFNIGRDNFYKKKLKACSYKTFIFCTKLFIVLISILGTQAFYDFQVLLHYYYSYILYIIIIRVVLCRNNKNQQQQKQNEKFKQKMHHIYRQKCTCTTFVMLNFNNSPCICICKHTHKNLIFRAFP